MHTVGVSALHQAGHLIGLALTDDVPHGIISGIDLSFIIIRFFLRVNICGEV